MHPLPALTALSVYHPGICWTLRMNSVTCKQTKCPAKYVTGWRVRLAGKWVWSSEEQKRSRDSGVLSTQCKQAYLWRGNKKFRVYNLWILHVQCMKKIKITAPIKYVKSSTSTDSTTALIIIPSKMQLCKEPADKFCKLSGPNIIRT